MEPQRVEDPRTRDLLLSLLCMARQLSPEDGAFKVKELKNKLADERVHFEMAQRWARMDLPEEWFSAFLRLKFFTSLERLMGELSPEKTKALLRFIDAEIHGLRDHWTSSNSFLEGSLRAYAEAREAHFQPEEQRPYLHQSVSHTRLLIFLFSMALIDFSLDNSAFEQGCLVVTEREMPGGDWPSDLARLRSLPDFEVDEDEFGRAKQ